MSEALTPRVRTRDQLLSARADRAQERAPGPASDAQPTRREPRIRARPRAVAEAAAPLEPRVRTRPQAASIAASRGVESTSGHATSYEVPDNDEPGHVNQLQAAVFLRVPVDDLRRLHDEGRGPCRMLRGDRSYYKKIDLEIFQVERRRRLEGQ